MLQIYYAEELKAYLLMCRCMAAVHFSGYGAPHAAVDEAGLKGIGNWLLTR